MITKKELTKEIANRAGITHKEAMSFDGVIFTIKEGAPRIARNPRTGETINVPAKKRATVRFGKAVKDILANMK